MSAERDEFGEARRVTQSSARLIFVVGNSRSGTTMVARMLDLHSEIHTLREVHFFEELWVPADRGVELPRDGAVTMSATLIDRARGRYQHTNDAARYTDEATAVVDSIAGPIAGERVLEATLLAEAAANDKSICCEQTPRNVYFVREILDMYPHARVVAVIRDPRDVLASQKSWWRKSSQDGERIAALVRFRHWANYHPWLTSMLWRGGARAQLAVQDLDRVISVRYEDVLRDAETVLRDVSAKLGVEYEPAMLQVRRFGSSLRQDETETGIDAARSGQWRTQLRPSEVWISQHTNAAEYTAFGYRAESTGRPWAGVIAIFAVLPLRLALVLALNLERSRSLLGSVKRRLVG